VSRYVGHCPQVGNTHRYASTGGTPVPPMLRTFQTSSERWRSVVSRQAGRGAHEKTANRCLTPSPPPHLSAIINHGLTAALLDPGAYRSPPGEWPYPDAHLLVLSPMTSPTRSKNPWTWGSELHHLRRRHHYLQEESVSTAALSRIYLEVLPVTASRGRVRWAARAGCGLCLKMRRLPRPHDG